MPIKSKNTLAQQYLSLLSGLNPQANIDSPGNYFDVEAQVIGGLLSGIYYDLDTFDKSLVPANASQQYLENLLSNFGQVGRKAGTPASGWVQVSADSYPFTVQEGAAFNFGDKVYLATQETEIQVDDSYVPVRSQLDGAEQNITVGAPLTTDISGIASVISAGILGGAGIETTYEMLLRVLDYLQVPVSNGRGADYNTIVQQFTMVRTVYAKNLGDILGQVYGVAIGVGGSVGDLDIAVESATIIEAQLSQADRDQIKNRLKELVPATDSLFVISPATKALDSLTVDVQLTGGTVGEVKRLVRKALLEYSFTPVEDNYHYRIYWNDVEEYVKENMGDLIRSVNICKDDGVTNLGTNLITMVDILLPDISVHQV